MSKSKSMIGLFGQHLHQLHAPIAVAPFIIIPADHFDETIAHRQREFAIEDAGVWITDDVLGNERLIAEFEHAFVAFI